MTLVCLDCTTAFAVGVGNCPHCGSERSAEEGSAAAVGVFPRGRVEEEPMPKITRHGGASDRHAAEPPAPVAEAGEGEQPSAGSNGETSSAKPSTTPAKSEKPRQSRARTTGNRSRQARGANSTADSTATGGPETAAADA